MDAASLRDGIQIGLIFSLCSGLIGFMFALGFKIWKSIIG